MTQGDPDKLRSTTGYTILMYGIPISTCSKIQGMPAKSSTNAEIIALTTITEEIVWIKNLLLDFNIDITPVIQEDNQPAIDTIKNNKLLRGNKHIARRYHFVKAYLDEGIIGIKYIPSEQNLADLYTKPLEKTKFEQFTSKFLYEK